MYCFFPVQQGVMFVLDNQGLSPLDEVCIFVDDDGLLLSI